MRSPTSDPDWVLVPTAQAYKRWQRTHNHTTEVPLVAAHTYIYIDIIDHNYKLNTEVVLFMALYITAPLTGTNCRVNSLIAS